MVSTNGKLGKEVLKVNALVRSVNLVSNELRAWQARGNQYAGKDVLDPRRDVNGECGWVAGEPTLQQYSYLYEREGIATRCVSVWPDECWAIHPELYEAAEEKETPFEAAWAALEESASPWHHLHRLDVLSGIGRFGAMLMGFDDGGDPESPVPGVGPDGQRRANARERQLLYLRPFDESCLTVSEYDADPSSRRFGRPLYYQVVIADPTLEGGGMLSSSAQGAPPEQGRDMKVHWTRMFHAAENKRNNDAFAAPRLKPVLNRIADLRKVLGGSAEMFWQGGFPGFSVETFPELSADDPDLDVESVKSQLEAYTNGMRRWLAISGMHVNSLAPQVADPTKHVEAQLRVICAAIRVPLRVFMGNESGLSASVQEGVVWNRRLRARQVNYLNPMMVKPFVRHLVACGALPPPAGLYVDWTDFNASSDKDKADTAMKKAQALLEFVTGGVESVMPPLYFFTEVMGLPLDRATAILDAASAAKASAGLTGKVWDKPAAAAPGPAGSKLNAGKRKPRNAQGRGAGP